MEPAYTIRSIARQQLDMAVDWAAAEGWNPGLEDADCFYRADPQGFLMGFLGDRPIAAISAVRYDNSFGFIGFYLVKPEWRGQGYGWQIWQAARARLQGCTVGLDGVVEQQANYQRAGFTLAHRNIRYGGTVQAAAVPAGVSEIGPDDLTAVLTYDRQFFPAARSPFLRCWLTQSGHRALGMAESGGLQGYGVVRPCRSGYKIGPLFADTGAIADALFRALTAGLPAGSFVYLDVPAVNGAAIALAEGYGLTRVFETARMYAGPAPALPLERIFGITTFELG